jgi:hypothetical protein
MTCPTCGHRTRIATASLDALRAAAGRLTAEELDTRLESALSARTLGELAELTADLPIAPAATGKDVLVVGQHGGRYVREGRWPVPARIELRTQECRVTLDFTRAVIGDLRDRLGVLGAVVLQP